jgi:maltose alpha-D-glucosyltransferase/alpha-amylase
MPDDKVTSWYRDAIIYELHVRSFQDSDNDGVGDFRGLTGRLDYLAELGVTALWLLPFYPSPLLDDGYDIADYYRVHPDYGTLADFRRFLRAAHHRGIRVITELVINHTSDQHPWFQRSRRASPGSPPREFYVWSDTAERYADARVIFKDYESSNWRWDPVAGAYFWHRFYSHQPDLNYDNPRVRREILRVLDFWFELGVDGMRLDAVPYLYEREGTNCENLPETHAFLKALRKHVDNTFPGRVLLAEANQWPEDAVAYFGEGDESHMCFHFPVMPRLFMALTMEDRFPVVDIMEQTPSLPGGCQWAMFLRNHDELTLEMVTDEERDYMYRVYAQDPRSRLNLGIRRRLAPLLGNDRRKIELMNILLFSLPGTPILYYGDEIGMGDNYYLGDRNGVRTPMQWSADRNAGFSRAGPQRLYLPVVIEAEYHFEAVNVENQEGSQSSLLWWTRHLIAARKHYPSLSRGELAMLFPENPHVLAFSRECEEETTLVVANLSRFHQVVRLDLARYTGHTPREIFSQHPFPPVREEPYLITLGPYGYLWLLMERRPELSRLAQEAQAMELSVHGEWSRVLRGETRSRLEEEALPAYLRRARWFAGKARTLSAARIVEEITLQRISGGKGPAGRLGPSPLLLLLEAQYEEEPGELYQLPLAYAGAEQAAELSSHLRHAIIARLSVDGERGVLYDGLYSEELQRLLLLLLGGRRRAKARLGQVMASSGRKLRSLQRAGTEELSPRVLGAEQSNSSLAYGNVFFLKLYRRLYEGSNPDPEMVRYLTREAGFPAVPAFAGSLEYYRKHAEPLALAMLQEYAPNQSDAWTLTLEELRHYLARVQTLPASAPEAEAGKASIFGVNHGNIPERIQELLGGVTLAHTTQLAQRTAEMHSALASPTENPDFAPEPFSRLYQRSLYQSLRSRVLRGLAAVAQGRNTVPEELRQEVGEALATKERILAVCRRVLEGRISGMKIRIHGDYHLGQVLYTGKDFLITDFEGEPMRPPSERRLKYSALRDVAGMVRSYHYAAFSALFRYTRVAPEQLPRLAPYAELWYRWVSGAFLSAYLGELQGTAFLPAEQGQIEILLSAFLLDKAVYELLYELSNRPDWIAIPVRSILSVLADVSV